IDGGDAGATEAIQGDAGGAHIVARFQGRHARQVAALLAALGAGTEDNVLDLAGIEFVALSQRLENGGAKVLGMFVRQCTLASFADTAWRAPGVDHPCFRHCRSPLNAVWPSGLSTGARVSRRRRWRPRWHRHW